MATSSQAEDLEEEPDLSPRFAGLLALYTTTETRDFNERLAKDIEEALRTGVPPVASAGKAAAKQATTRRVTNPYNDFCRQYRPVMEARLVEGMPPGHKLPSNKVLFGLASKGWNACSKAQLYSRLFAANPEDERLLEIIHSVPTPEGVTVPVAEQNVEEAEPAQEENLVVIAAPGATAEAAQSGPGTPEVKASVTSVVEGAPPGAEVEKVAPLLQKKGKKRISVAKEAGAADGEKQGRKKASGGEVAPPGQASAVTKKKRKSIDGESKPKKKSKTQATGTD